MEIITRECPICHNYFNITAIRIRHGRGKYCSPECRKKGVGLDNRSKLADGSPAPLMVTLECIECHKLFSIKRCIYDHSLMIGSPTSFCSVECKNRSQVVRDTISKSLKNSDKFKSSKLVTYPKMVATCRTPEIREKHSKIEKSVWQDSEKRINLMNGIKDRSLNIDWLNSPQFQSGINHPAYIGNRTARETSMHRYEYQQWRKSVYERDNYTCKKCGIRGGRLHAHHIKDWSNNPDVRFELSNGITLCKSCHFKIHHPSVI